MHARDADPGQASREFAAADSVEMKAETRAAEDEGREQEKDGEDEKRDRNAIDVALSQNQEVVVVDQRALKIVNVGTVERQSDAANDVERRERDDERRDAKARDQQPVQETRDCADHDRDRNGDGRVHAAETDHIVDGDAGDQQHRADGKVDAAADEDEGLADRDDAEDRKIAQRLGEVVECGEARRRGPEQDDQGNERDREPLCPGSRERAPNASPERPSRAAQRRDRRWGFDHRNRSRRLTRPARVPNRCWRS